MTDRRLTESLFYEDSLVTLYCGDCRAIMPQLAQGFDLALTDPPYNVGIEYGENVDDERADYESWCADWFWMLRSSCDAVALTPGIANVALWNRICAPDWTLAWHKPSAMSRCYIGFNNWEPVLYWGPRRNSVDVVTAPIIPDPSLDGHPCPKPLKWATGLISILTDTGARILDPFAGSGTTLRAAKDLGRSAVGIEVEPRYCEIAIRRLGQEVLDVAV